MKNKHFILVLLLLAGSFSACSQKTLFVDYLKGVKELWLNNQKVSLIMTDTTLAGATDNAIPTAKAVKAYVQNHSGGGGGGGGDDWGAQVVETGSGLVGDGTAGNPLDWAGASVSGPLTGSGTALSPLNILNGSINGTHLANGAVDLASADVTGLTPTSRGGTGTSGLTGYVKADGANPMTANSLIPESDISNDALLARVSSTENISGAWTFTNTSNRFRDNAFTLSDDGDNTRLANFQLSNISTGTTRTLTVQNKNYTIAATDDAAGGDASGTLGALTVTKIQGKSVPAPVAGDDLKLLQYNHTSGQFQYAAGGGGADNWGSQVVQKDATLTGDGTAGNVLGLADNGVTNAKMADNSVGNAELADNAVNTAELANNAVTLAKLQDVASGVILGRSTASPGDPELLTPGTGINIAGGQVVNTGDTNAADDQPLDATLSALAGLNTTAGIVVQTGTDAFNKRTLTGTANKINVTNGDGVSGNPTFDVGSDVTQNTATQTLTNKTLTSPTINTPTITVNDNVFTVQDQTDNTKKFQLEASSIGAGTTRTLTVQNKNYTIAATDDAAGGDASGTLGALTVTKIQGKSVPAPAAGDDLKLLQYNHTSGQFQYAAGGGGADNWGSQVVQKDATLTGDGTAGNVLGLADNGVTNAKMADNSVGNAELLDNAVGNAELADNAVNTAELANNAVTLAKLQDVASGVILGRSTALSGDPELLTPGTGINITGGLVVNTGDTNAADDQPLDATLSALAGLNTTAGIVVQTGTDAFNKRTLTGTTNKITVTNGDGVGGNPTFDVGSDVTQNAATQTLTNKTLTSPTINTPTITVNDNALTVQDQTDNTKKFQLEASSIGAGTTRTLVVQNKNYTIAGTDDAAGGDVSGTLSNLQIGASVVGPTEIADNAVTLAKLQDVASGVILGRSTALSGDPELLTPGTGINITGGQVVNTGDTNAADDQPLDATLSALAGLNTTAGIVVQTGTDAFNKRTLTGTTNKITVTNGDGVGGNPTLDVGSDVTQNAATQTLTNKTLTSPTINTPTITVNDNALTVQDQTDNTKKFQLEASSIGAGTTRTLVVQNKNYTIAATDDAAGGDVSGTLSNLQIGASVVGPTELADDAVTNSKLANNAVNTSELADAAVTMVKLNQGGASNGQVIKWNGTAWAAASDDSGAPAGSPNQTTRYDGSSNLVASGQFLNNGTECSIGTSLEAGVELKVGGLTKITATTELIGSGIPISTTDAAALRLTNTVAGNTWYFGALNNAQYRTYWEGSLFQIMKPSTAEIMHFGSATYGLAQKSLAEARLAVSDSSATNVFGIVENKQAASTSSAEWVVKANGGSAGDAAVQFTNTVSTYEMGLDNSNNDYFVISNSGTLGTSDILRATSGKIGVGATNPLGNVALTLPAGTTTVAPFALTSGTNLTTVQNGAVEYDGTNYFASAGGTRYTLSKTLTNTASLNFPNTANNDYADLTITVTGAAVGDVVTLGIPNASVVLGAIHFMAWVSAANTVTVRLINADDQAWDPAAGTFRVSVTKY